MVEEFGDAFAGEDGDEDGVGEAGAEEEAGGGVVGLAEFVNFIEDDEGGFVGGVEFVEDVEGGLVEFEDAGVGGVEEMDEEVGVGDFFEGGVEGLDEEVGEFADEADGIGEEEGLVVRELDFAGGSIEGSEEFVFDEGIGAGEAVKEGGFAGVGVADDGCGGDWGA